MIRGLDPRDAPEPFTRAARGGYGGDPLAFYADLLGRCVAMLLPGVVGRWLGRGIFWIIAVTSALVGLGLFLLQFVEAVSRIAHWFY